MSFALSAMVDVLGPFIGQSSFSNDKVWWFASMIMVVYSMLAWVRKLHYFASGYVLGCFMILFTVCVINGYCIKGLIYDGPDNNDFYKANTSHPKQLVNAIGYAFYCFEGIGTVMPIYEQTQAYVNFKGVVIGSIAVLAILYVGFGTLCFYYFEHVSEQKRNVIEKLD